jgi:hypothetical protein
MLPPAQRNQLVVVGCLVGLVGNAAPTLAKTSFEVFLDSSTPVTGVKGKMSLGITNASSASGPTSGTLVGFAFKEPLLNNGTEAISLTRYNPLASVFGLVIGGTTGVIANHGANFDTALTITNLSPAPYAPFPTSISEGA